MRRKGSARKAAEPGAAPAPLVPFGTLVWVRCHGGAPLADPAEGIVLGHDGDGATVRWSPYWEACHASGQVHLMGRVQPPE